MKQIGPLMENLVPRAAFAKVEMRVAVSFPFLEQDRCTVLATKVSAQGFFETAAKNHRSANILFPPTVEVAKPIAARAPQVLADLGVAIDHGQPPHFLRPGPLELQLLPTPSPARRRQGSETRADRASRERSAAHLSDQAKLSHPPHHAQMGRRHAQSLGETS